MKNPSYFFRFLLVVLFLFQGQNFLLAHGSHQPEGESHKTPQLKKETQISEEKIRALETYIEDQGISVETSQAGIKLGGFVDVGYVYNFNGGRTSSGKGENPITGEDSQDFNLNKVQIYLAKELPEENRLAAGFVFTLDFGEDVEQGHLHGGHDHDEHEGGHGDMELHEAAVLFRAPVGNGLDVTLGKWHSLLGYESHDRPYNMNYTFGLLSRFLDPGEHIGLLLTYPVTDWFTVDLGLANGWANEDSAFLDDADFSKMLTGAFTFRNPGKNAWLRMGFAYSPEGEERFSNVATADHSDHKHNESEELLQENEGVLALALHGDWRPVFAKNRWLLGFNASLLLAEDNLHRAELRADEEHDHEEAEHEHEEHEGEHEEDHQLRYGPGVGKNSATAWGLALYSRYQFCDWFSLRGRLEYLHANDGTLGFVDGLNASSIDRNQVFVSSTDLYSWTMTAGFDVWANMVLRLEYRLDMSSSNGAGNLGAFQNNQDQQHTFALNAAYLF